MQHFSSVDSLKVIFISSTLLMSAVFASQGSDVSFYSAFKVEKYNQGGAGPPTLGGGSPYRFGAVVAPTVAGSVTNATVSAAGPPQPLTPDPVFTPWLSFGEKFASQTALDTAFPVGNYDFVIQTLNQGLKNPSLNLPSEAFPPGPHISNWAAAQTVNAGADFTLTWDAFAGGTTNDLILVAVGDPITGTVYFRSPDPLQPGVLNGTATSVMIPANSLHASTTYQVEIIFFKVKSTDTTSYPGATGIVGFESFTDSSLTTSQEPDVSFYTLFKAEKYNQGGAGLPTPGGGSPYRFGAVVAPTVAGSVTNATVSGVGPPQPLTPDPVFTPWLSFGEKFPTQAALDTAFPAGDYHFIIQTLNQGLKNPSLNLPSETFPPGPHISNWSVAQSINAGANFTLTWDSFVGGTANDLILVAVGDPITGIVYFRSPDPLQPGALNGTSTSVVIPANTLAPHTTYQVEIVFFKVNSTDTASYPGVIGIVGFESFTDSSLATSPNSFSLSFRQIARAGRFLGDTNATPSFPVVINGYRAEFIVRGPTNFAAPANVLITGPPGSGLTNASTSLSSSDTSGFYFTSEITQPPIPPAGTWSAKYAGPVYDFADPNLQVDAHLVVPVPSLRLNNGLLQSTTWRYYDTNGNALAGSPGFLTSIQVQTLDTTGALSYNSEVLTPATRSYSFTNSLSWTNVGALRFLYDDGKNSYIVAYSNVINTAAAPIELTALDLTAGAFDFLLTGQAGHSYQLQFSGDLSHWTNWITTNLPTATVELTDPQPANALLFYRAKLVN